MKYTHSTEGIPCWLDFVSVCSQLAWKYMGSPFLRFRLNGRDINVSKLEIGDVCGTIYVNLIEDVNDATKEEGAE